MVIINLSVLLSLLTVIPAMGQVSGLKAEFRKGKTFITFTEEAGPGKTFNLYRSHSPITSVADIAPVVNIPDSSSYDKRYKFYHIITDSGPRLEDGTGLFVYTPKESAAVYYAVTVVTGSTEDKTLTAGENTLSEAVAEQYWPWPSPVIDTVIHRYEGTIWKCFFWQDYFDWNNNYDYYGDMYYVQFSPQYKADMAQGIPAPVTVGLHGAGGEAFLEPSGYPNYSAVCITLRDHPLAAGYAWWYGWSNGSVPPVKGDTIINYKERQIRQYIQALRNDPAMCIDTNRIYISGGSMGGSGAILNGAHGSEFFAAVEGIAPAIKFEYCWYFASGGYDTVHYGAKRDSLTARNGVNIYNWNDAGWVVGNHPTWDFPVFILGGSSSDGGMPLWMERWMYRNCAKSKVPVFGSWCDCAHAGPSPSVPGGMYRFKRNEVVPAFRNASHDDNYGLNGPDTNSPPEQIFPGDIITDSTGQMNGYIDWSSSLHDLGLPNDNIIDNEDTLSITFKAIDSMRMEGLTCYTPHESTFVDITPRRIQNFPVVVGNAYHWTCVSVASGVIMDSGIIVPDSLGFLTVPGFLVLKSGSRLVITSGGPMAMKSETSSPSSVLTASPDPFNPSTEIRFSLFKEGVVRLTVYGIDGRLVSTLCNHGFARGNHRISWNARTLAAGVYIVEMRAKGLRAQKRITLLK